MSEVVYSKRLLLYEKKIGYECTKKELLRKALTHSSEANEKRVKKLANNERLELIGDAVLEVGTSDVLYNQ